MIELDDDMKKYMDVLFISRSNDGKQYSILGGRKCLEKDFPGSAYPIFEKYQNLGWPLICPDQPENLGSIGGSRFSNDSTFV